MSPFLWFAIALTVGYVIYYTVMIMNDLYGKKPDDKDTTEEIEAPTGGAEAIPDDAPTIVSESEGGFNVGGEEYDASFTPDYEDTEEESETSNKDDTTAKPSPAETIRQTADAYCEEIESAFDDEYEKEEFRAVLMNEGKVDNRPNVAVTLVNDEI